MSEQLFWLCLLYPIGSKYLSFLTLHWRKRCYALSRFVLQVYRRHSWIFGECTHCFFGVDKSQGNWQIYSMSASQMILTAVVKPTWWKLTRMKFPALVWVNEKELFLCLFVFLLENLPLCWKNAQLQVRKHTWSSQVKPGQLQEHQWAGMPKLLQVGV